MRFRAALIAACVLHLGIYFVGRRSRAVDRTSTLSTPVEFTQQDRRVDSDLVHRELVAKRRIVSSAAPAAPIERIVEKIDAESVAMPIVPEGGTDVDNATPLPGTTGARGATTGDPVAGLRDVQFRDLLVRLRRVRRYPELARRREIEGVVRVAFRVLPDGTPTDVHTIVSADPLLDSAAIEAVLRAVPLPTLEGLIEVDLEFRLDAHLPKDD